MSGVPSSGINTPAHKVARIFAVSAPVVEYRAAFGKESILKSQLDWTRKPRSTNSSLVPGDLSHIENSCV